MRTKRPELGTPQMELEELFDQITYDLAKSYEMEAGPRDPGAQSKIKKEVPLSDPRHKD